MSSCSKSGPEVTLCLVDVKNSGFQCVTYPNKSFYLPLKGGLKFVCASPGEVEDAIKACQNHQILLITLCRLHPGLNQFVCKDPHGVESPLPLEDADNYGCMSTQDYKRLLQRCNPVHEFSMSEFEASGS